MANLLCAALVPHPPILHPAVGGEESERCRTTRDSLRRLAEDLAGLDPEVVVVISPHGPIFSDAIAVHRLESIGGDLGAFGAPQVGLTLPIDRKVGELLLKEARSAGLPVAPVTPETAPEWEAERLDHATLLPLLFLTEAGWRGSILPVAMGMLPLIQLYAFGQALQRAIERSGRRAVVLASGDLSHRLTAEAPEGFSPAGERFDRQVVEAIGRGDLAALFAIEPDLRERAAECGYRPLLMLAGALDGRRVHPQVYSYEYPFGVGYAVAVLEPGEEDESRRLYPKLEQARSERIRRERERAHPIVQLARAALEHYVTTGLEVDFSAAAPHAGTAPWQLPPDLPERAGVFVTLTIDGDLRGCMGSVEPTESKLALEVVQSAIQAGTADPRFLPVEEEELPFLSYSVDVLGPLEPATPEDLDPAEFGLLVSKGEEIGLLLPALPGIETPGQQIEIACRKAGLEPDDPDLKLERFRVTRFR